MSANLMRVIGELVSDPNSVNEMHDHPEDFMEKYNLTEEEKVLLCTCCQPLLGDLFKNELMKHVPVAHARWPRPRPRIHEVAPSSAKVGTIPEILIMGEGILHNAVAKLVKRDEKGAEIATIELTNVTCTKGPYIKEFKKLGFKQKRLRTQGDLKKAEPGIYDVEVHNSADYQISDTLKEMYGWDTKSSGLQGLIKKAAFEII